MMIEIEQPDMTLSSYQVKATTTAITNKPQLEMLCYLVMKLNGEAGEVAEKFAKWAIRDGSLPLTSDQRFELAKELGDVLWYVAIIAAELEFDLADVAMLNLAKLADRKRRGVLHGSGDNR